MLQGLLAPRPISHSSWITYASGHCAYDPRAVKDRTKNQDDYTVQSPRAVVKGNMAENPHPT